MAKDKRLLICKSIIVHAQRLITEKKLNQQQQERYAAADDVPVWIEFTVPPKLLVAEQNTPKQQQQQQNSTNTNVSTTATGAFTVEDKTFLLPHSVVARTGRGSVLFVANDIAFDVAKINKRYNLFDAVISLDSLINDEKMGPKKASIAASTFSRFVFDDRVAQHPRLPRCLKQIALKQAPHQDQLTVSLLTNLVEERENQSLIFVLKQAGQGTKVEFVDKQQQSSQQQGKGSSSSTSSTTTTTTTTTTSGAVRVRIGHCGMTAGAITENGKEFLKSLRADFPQVARSIQVVNLTTSITRPIQWMELQISR
jgi:hypothetical protein